MQAVIRVSQLRKDDTHLWTRLHCFQEQLHSSRPNHDIRIQQEQKFSLRLFESDIGCGAETDVFSILNGLHPRFAQSLNRREIGRAIIVHHKNFYIFQVNVTEQRFQTSIQQFPRPVVDNDHRKKRH